MAAHSPPDNSSDKELKAGPGRQSGGFFHGIMRGRSSTSVPFPSPTPVTISHLTTSILGLQTTPNSHRRRCVQRLRCNRAVNVQRLGVCSGLAPVLPSSRDKDGALQKAGFMETIQCIQQLHFRKTFVRENVVRIIRVILDEISTSG